MRAFIALSAILVSACSVGSPIQAYDTLRQPKGQVLQAGVGDDLVRVDKSSDLPNLCGKADIYGGKREGGFTEVRFAGITPDGNLILRRTDVEVNSNETTLTNS